MTEALGKHHSRIAPNFELKLPPERLEPNEVRLLMDACDRTTIGLRNRGLLVVLYRGGLKLGEALALRIRDVDADAHALHLGSAKRSRSIGLDTRAWQMLAEWLEVRDGLGLGDGPLFCTLKGGPLQSGYIRTWLPKLAEDAGVHRRVHSQAFRHTFAGELVLEGRSLTFIQEVLGLANLASTEGYLDELAIPRPDPVAALRARPWAVIDDQPELAAAEAA